MFLKKQFLSTCTKKMIFKKLSDGSKFSQSVTLPVCPKAPKSQTILINDFKSDFHVFKKNFHKVQIN